MDELNKAISVIAKLHQEKDEFHAKKVKAKKAALICLIIGLVFLLAFIITISITSGNYNFSVGVILFIIFAVFAFIFLEGAIVLFVLAKCLYEYQENNRIKLLECINKQVNQNKIKRNE